MRDPFLEGGLIPVGKEEERDVVTAAEPGNQFTGYPSPTVSASQRRSEGQDEKQPKTSPRQSHSPGQILRLAPRTLDHSRRVGRE